MSSIASNLKQSISNLNKKQLLKYSTAGLLSSLISLLVITLASTNGKEAYYNCALVSIPIIGLIMAIGDIDKILEERDGKYMIPVSEASTLGYSLFYGTLISILSVGISLKILY